MATPKSTSLNYAKLRNQKRNNSNVDIEKDLGNLYRTQDNFQSSSNNGLQPIDNNNTIFEKKGAQNNYNQASQMVNNIQDTQQNQLGNSKGANSLPSAGQINQNQQQLVSYPIKLQQLQSNSQNQKNIQDLQNKQSQSQQNEGQNITVQKKQDSFQNEQKEFNQNQIKIHNQQQYQQEQQIQSQEKKGQPNDAAYQSNQAYIDQMIKQKKHVEDPSKTKQKNMVGKTPIPPFMKNFHQMQQMQQQQELFMKQQKNKQQLKNSQSQHQQQQNSDDTVRLNQTSSLQSTQLKSNIQKQETDDSLQLENTSQFNEQQSNQDEKLTQRKTLGNSQPKLFDQFFRNNSYQGSMSQSTSQPPPQITVAQTQRNTNSHQEKVQNISVLSNQSDLKNSNNTSQILTQPAQSQQQQLPQNNFNASPSHANEQSSNTHNSNQHQNHHLSSINRDVPNNNKRLSHTQIHQHQSEQNQLENHQKKESSLFNSQSSTILNNSLGNISPTAQFNNLDSSQFNISNISNIQNLSNNVSSINNQSNIMINYNSNNVMNNSNVNSTMSFQKQFEEHLPYNELNQGKEEVQNSNFLNSLNIYIDYFNSSNLQENDNKVKAQQSFNHNVELFKENQRLKSQIEQLEEKLKETETSRKILINDLSKIKNRDIEYKKQLVKENNETKNLLLSTNYKLHHTKEQYAKEKIEHENTKFTLKKALLVRSNNLENNNLLNKAENMISQQKNQPHKKSFLQQHNLQENRSLQNNSKFGINNQNTLQYQRTYQNSNKINELQNYYMNNKQYQTIGPSIYSNPNDPPSLSSLVVNQQQVYDGEQTAMSRIVDQDLKMVDPIYVNQSLPQNFSNQISLQQNIQEMPLIADRYNGPAFGGGLQNMQQQNEFDELECKDFNLDDSNQNLDVSGPEVFQDNQNMIGRDDFTDNTTDIINLNQPSPSIHVQNGITAQTGGVRVNSMHQQKYQNSSIPIFDTNQQLTSNNQLGYKQQQASGGIGMQEDEYEQDGEDMDLSDNFNLDTDNQMIEDNSALNLDNQNKGQLEAFTQPVQSDIDLIQDGQHQYYDYQSNKVFNTYDNSNFKYSTHRDHIDSKGMGQLAATTSSYKKGVGSLDEDHVYQMMKLQYHPNSYDINKQGLNLKMGSNNLNSMQNQQNQKSQLKKQQICQNRNQQGGRTMSLSYQKPQFSSQQIQMFQMMQNQKQKMNMQQQQQQQQQYLQQQQLLPYAAYL